MEHLPLNNTSSCVGAWCSLPPVDKPAYWAGNHDQNQSEHASARTVCVDTDLSSMPFKAQMPEVC